MSEEYSGIIASTGITMGKLYLFEKEELEIPMGKIAEDEVDLEIEKVTAAINSYIEDLKALQNSSGEASAIAGAHIELLEDPFFVDTIKEKIKEKENACLALHETVEEMAETIALLDDDYLKERAADYKDIGERVQYKLQGKVPKSLNKLDDEYIVIANELTPSDTSTMDKEKVLGFATNLGGKTSHTSIIAQTLNIPALVGMGDITEKVSGGEFAILDGNEGKIIVNPSEELIEKYKSQIKSQKEEEARLFELRNKEAVSLDGKRCEVSANIGNLEDLELAIENGCDGVGLFRTEFLYMQNTHFPTEDEQFEVYKKAAQMLEGKPLVIRTLDIGGDKGLSYFDFPQEENPFLGYRAVRFCLRNKDVFKTQLRAIVRASAFGNIKIMIPMIISCGEFLSSKALIKEIMEDLDKEGISYNKDMEIGIMVETPAAVIMADKLIKYVDFFSIGTNDLTQYVLAVDRGNENISDLYSNYNPAVLRAIGRVIEESHKHGKWTGMCGQFAGDTQATKLLLGLGLDEFSMASSKIAKVKDTIISSSQKEEAEFSKEILDLESASQVEEKIKDYISR